MTARARGAAPAFSEAPRTVISAWAPGRRAAFSPGPNKALCAGVRSLAPPPTNIPASVSNTAVVRCVWAIGSNTLWISFARVAREDAGDEGTESPADPAARLFAMVTIETCKKNAIFTAKRKEARSGGCRRVIERGCVGDPRGRCGDARKVHRYHPAVHWPGYVW